MILDDYILTLSKYCGISFAIRSAVFGAISDVFNTAQLPNLTSVKYLLITKICKPILNFIPAAMAPTNGNRSNIVG